MKFSHYTILISTLIYSLTSCSKPDYIFKLNTTPKTTIGNKASINIKQLEGGKFDSIQLFINDKKISLNNNSSEINTSNLGTGKHTVTALVFAPNKVIKLQNNIEVLSKNAPKLYSYKVLNEYPHDTKAYTQGLEFHNGFLYETTGRVGQSWLRKIDYKTGNVLQQTELKDYFGEGMTIFNNSVYWLTWQSGNGFIYNADDFTNKGKFQYNKSEEGWGLTHNNKHLIKTDGTNNIWFLNPENGEEIHHLQAYTNKDAIDRLNEAEYVNGKIFINRWITDTPVRSIIVVVDEKTGIVEGVIDLNKLRQKILETQKLDVDEVLNGIAYNPETKTFFVTGKNWNKLFEIEINLP